MTEMEVRMAQLQERFRARAASDGVRIAAAMEAKDVEKVRQIAHGLSGSGGVFGFPAVSADAEAVERGIDAELSEPEITALCDRLLKRLAELSQLL